MCFLQFNPLPLYFPPPKLSHYEAVVVSEWYKSFPVICFEGGNWHCEHLLKKNSPNHLTKYRLEKPSGIPGANGDPAVLLELHALLAKMLGPFLESEGLTSSLSYSVGVL